MKPRRQLIVSTVGTSLLTNQAREESLRKMLIKLANLGQDELTDEQRQLIDAHLEQAKEVLKSGQDECIRKASAELSGIFGLYGGRPPGSSADLHLLIATDTAMGRIAAETVRDFLVVCGLNCSLVDDVRSLSTRDQNQFGQGIRNLVQWCSKALPGYREAGYHVVLNLVGGFKSLQGYLNTIGMLYADEIVYLFEGTTDLLRIPRLPIRLDVEGLESWRTPFALMAADFPQPADLFRGCPEVLLDEYESGRFLLSDWGTLIWNDQKEQLLADSLIELPRLRYDPQFLRDFEQHDNRRNRVKLQETLARVASLLEASGGDRASLARDGGLRYERLAGKQAGLDHFRVDLSLRVECRPVNGGLELVAFGEHEGRYR